MGWSTRSMRRSPLAVSGTNASILLDTNRFGQMRSEEMVPPSVAEIFPLIRLVMDDAELQKIDFTSLSPEDIIRLGEDFYRALLVLHRDGRLHSIWRKEVECAELIFKAVSRAGKCPTREAAVLADAFHKAVRLIHHSVSSLRYLWFRLYVHALLRGSHVFLDVLLCDELPLDHTPIGFADIWKGNYRGELVCIKAVRTRSTFRLEEIKRTFCRKVEGSKYPSHPNLLPIIQVSKTLFPFCVMSPWMLNGNIVQYTQTNQNANRLLLLAGVSQGLSYLHGLGIIHGCLSPGNILITRDGRACLGDFGIAGAYSNPWDPMYKLETVRYMAPERFDLDIVFLSKEGDVYSLAMASFMVLTEVLPYGDAFYHNSVVSRIQSGKRPDRPKDPYQARWLRDGVWDMITACWSDIPHHRWGVPAVCNLLSTLSLQEVPRQQPGKIRPRITSLFQFVRDSAPEIERRVNEVDMRLENPDLSDRERQKLFNELCKTCSRHHVIPKSMHIPDCSKGSVEVEDGGYATVSRGTYGGREVAIKVVRVYLTSDLRIILSRFCREGVAWKHLRHPNILPLLGVTVNEHRLAMVSEWMENENINKFVEKDRYVNRTELLVDVASGLKYMHDLRIVHGDLKGANILINKDRRACIADFGLTTITGVVTRASVRASRMSLISNDTLMSFTSGGTHRWMSPELLDPERFGMLESEGNRPTRQSDCYALGMVIYEVLCGHYPYHEIHLNVLVMGAIVEGVRPNKPEGAKRLGFSNELWKTVERCWREDRRARPSVQDILSCLNEAAAFWCVREH